MAHAATDQMRRRPHHLRVMTDLEELIRRIGPVLEVLVLHVPHSDREVPATFRRMIRRERFRFAVVANCMRAP